MNNNENFDYEDMVEGNESSTVVQQQQSVDVGDDVAPVNLSKGKVLAIVIFAIVILIFLLILFDGIALTKNTGISSQNSETKISTSQSTSVGSVNSGDVFTENSENSVVSVEVDSSSLNKVNGDISTETKEIVETSSEGVGVVIGEIVREEETDSVEKTGFEQLAEEPVMGAEVVVSGIVKGISMYRVGNSYTYGVNLILVTGNDVEVECTYFCPKKTADALSIGDSLVVVYRGDAEGNVCVVSISR